MAGIPGENGRPANKGEKGKRVTTVGVEAGRGCAVPKALKGTNSTRTAEKTTILEGSSYFYFYVGNVPIISVQKKPLHTIDMY